MTTEDVFKPHGVVRVSALLRIGVTKRQIAERVEAGAWARPARGWVANGSVDAVVETAVRAGAALTCISALRRLDVWCPADSTTHLRRTDHHRRAAKAGTRTCAPMGRPRPVPLPVDTLRLALESAAGCLDEDDLTAVIDSILNKELATEAEVREWLSGYRVATRNALARCDGLAESGTESLVRIRLRRRRIKLRLQVQIGEVGRVDLVVGQRLVIEVDSKAHHTSAAAYENDRRRDRQLSGLGYLVVRVSYDQVMHAWDQVEADLLAMIRRGDHLWPRSFLRGSGSRTPREGPAPRSA